MKTAISLSDDTFRRVEDGAAALRISRSEFFARAAELYLAHLESQALSARVDEVLARIGDDDDRVGALGLQRLAQLTEDDEW